MCATRQTGVARRRLRQEQTRRLIAIGLVYFVSTGITSAADREMTREYLTCLEKASGVTFEMIACIVPKQSVKTSVLMSTTTN